MDQELKRLESVKEKGGWYQPALYVLTFGGTSTVKRIEPRVIEFKFEAKEVR